MNKMLVVAGIAMTLSASVSSADLAVRTVALSGQAAPGTTGQFLAFQDVVLNGSGQVAFMGQLAPSVGLGGGDLGIWSEGSGSLACVTRTDLDAPGTSGTFQALQSGSDELNLNDSGTVGFRGSTIDQWGIWLGDTNVLQPFAIQTTAAPGAASGTTFIFPGQVITNPSGAITFYAQLSGSNPNPAISNEGIWTNVGGTLHAVVVNGNAAPGLPGSVMAGLGSPSMNRSGTLAFSGLYFPASTSTTLSSALWVADPSGPTPRYLSGSVAPGTGGLTFASFGDVDLNNAGKVAFSAYLAGSNPSVSYGYWSDADGSLQLLARKGDPAIGMPGLAYSLLDRFRISSGGRVAFTATAVGTGGNNQYGIWAGLPGNMNLVAGSGMAVPGLPGATFASFASPDLNASGLLAFEAYVQGSVAGPGIWADDPAGNLIPVVLPTDTLGTGKQILDLSLAAFTGGDGSGQPRYLNDAGQIAFQATFKDDSQGVFVVTVPEPACLGLVALAAIGLLRRRVSAHDRGQLEVDEVVRTSRRFGTAVDRCQ